MTGPLRLTFDPLPPLDDQEAPPGGEAGVRDVSDVPSDLGLQPRDVTLVAALLLHRLCACTHRHQVYYVLVRAY